jgi:hypothetical protein
MASSRARKSDGFVLAWAIALLAMYLGVSFDRRLASPLPKVRSGASSS